MKISLCLYNYVLMYLWNLFPTKCAVHPYAWSWEASTQNYIYACLYLSPHGYTHSMKSSLKGQKEGIIYSIEPRVSLQVLSHSFKKTQNKIWNEKCEFQAAIKLHMKLILAH